MPSDLLHVGPLADEPLDAAADFHARILPAAEGALAGGANPLTLVFFPATYEQRGWRLAVVQGLARRFAPSRVNAIESDEPAAIAAARRYLDAAPGVTGQYMPLDSHGAGPVLS